MINNKHFQSILKIIRSLTYAYDTWAIFNDFLEMAAICINNTFDLQQFDAREKQYLSTINKYPPDVQKLFPEMFAELVLALEHEYQSGSFTDVLGTLFHELELHNKWRGQFFTPGHICVMMGKMLIGDHDKAIEEQGYISVMEPACGSGAMVLGFAQAMRDYNYNHSQQLLVTAIDIDLKCIYMCYIQLSLYGIPAKVVHGDSLTLETWSCWYIPAYIINGWGWRSRKRSDGVVPDVKIDTEPIADNTQEPLKDTQPKVVMPTSKEVMQLHKQLSLFDIE